MTIFGRSFIAFCFAWCAACLLVTIVSLVLAINAQLGIGAYAFFISAALTAVSGFLGYAIFDQ